MTTENQHTTAELKVGIDKSNTHFRFSRKAKLATIFGILSLLAVQPAAAQAWAEQTGQVVNSIGTGLKYLTRGIGFAVIGWSVIMIWIGNKRLQDLVPFFIGAAILIAAPELLKLIP